MPSRVRQFRVLYRFFVMYLIDLELLAPGGNAEKLIGHLGGLLGGFGLVLAIYTVPKYALSTLPPDQLTRAGWGDQEFFIATTMVVVALFAVLAWDAVFPRRQDALVLGLLPVRASTVFRAKIAAVTTGLAASILAVNFATGLSYPFVAAAPGSDALGGLRAFLAYWLTMASAGSFVFCTLLAIQGLAAQLLSFRLFLRVSNFLQLTAFFVAMTLYVLTPGPSDFLLVKLENQGWLGWLPSFWFLGLYGKLNGTPHPVFGAFAGRAVAGLLTGAAIAIVSYSLAYRRNIQRTIEQPDIAPAYRTKASRRLVRWIAARVSSSQLERAVFLFISRTLARSRQHRTLLAALGGVGLAISLTFTRSILYGASPLYEELRRFGYVAPRWDRPNSRVMAAGLVLLVAAILGTRALFSLPATLKANWIFQLTAVHSPRAYFAAVRQAMFQIVAGPVLVGLAIAHVAVWPPLPALVHVGVLIAIAFVLVNHAVADFRKIPFTCSYLPGKLNLKVKLAPYAVGLLFVISLGSTIEYSLIKTPARVVVLSAILLAAAIQAQRRWEQFASAPFQGLQFEEVDASEVAPLVLGDGSVYGKQQRYLDFIHAPPDPTFRERALRFLRRSTVVSAVACIVGVTYEHVSQRLHPVPPRIGQLVDIGGRSLNIFCSGEGSPAVIFEGGRGRPGYSWVVVQREVARFTRACWYDRAGYGWSDPAPYPHSAAVIARDLHQLLKKHGAAPPYVLVGSSFGGLVVRVYSRTYSNHVAGMVLVDSSHADFRVPITRTGFFHLDSVQRTMVCFIWLLKQTGVLRLVMQQTEERTVPQGYTENEIRLMSSFEPRTAAESFKEMELESHIQARAAGGFGNRPLIVLTAGRLQRPPTDPVDLDQLRRDEWIEVQQQLAALSTRGRQIVLADSGHGIQFDRPDAVIDAVHQVVSAVRIGR